jgi:hypothetical protein
MADIEVYKGRYRTWVIGTTPLGTRWLQDNIDFKNRYYSTRVEVVVSLDKDYSGEFVELLENTGLEIDVR